MWTVQSNGGGVFVKFMTTWPVVWMELFDVRGRENASCDYGFVPCFIYVLGDN